MVIVSTIKANQSVQNVYKNVVSYVWNDRYNISMYIAQKTYWPDLFECYGDGDYMVVVVVHFGPLWTYTAL